MEPLAVEQPGGRGVEHSHLPHRLVCIDSRCNTASIVAVIKAQDQHKTSCEIDLIQAPCRCAVRPPPAPVA